MSHAHRWTGLHVAALLLATLGCSSEGRPPQGPAAPPPAAASQPAAPATAPAAAAAAARTTLRGVAQNAKAGAVVVTDRGAVYVRGLDAWPAALAGRTVEVTGAVRRQKHVPDPVGPGGTIAQGAWGEQTVIEGATWRAVE